MNSVEYNPIGTIYSPHKELHGMPIQPVGAKGVKGLIELNNEFEKGLKDLDGFSHIILIYDLHLCNGHKLTVKPFLDKVERGIFATRAPKRPNPIGISVVRLEKIEGNKLYISNVDIHDGTPLLDIKPYIPDFDATEGEKLKLGWYADKHHHAKEKKSDKRFVD
ncbi:MAG: tRNA (N6-threonylcarbamoyladenosine(37)-N6)-methyltransferase TrmO [Methanobacterium sp.]|nr:tRNA (N6-threonylcarbamoyladenosine(37)-N6)-methyltransferase TrmO [Methanobacterium sp.]